MTKQDIQEQLTQANKLLAGVDKEIIGAQKKLDKDVTQERLDALSTLQGKCDTLRGTIERLTEALSQADAEEAKAAALLALEEYKAVLPSLMAVMRDGAKTYRAAVLAMREAGYELQKVYENFSAASEKGVAYDGFTFGFLHLDQALRWVQRQIWGDHSKDTARWVERELDGLDESLNELEIRATARAKRRYDEIVDPKPGVKSPWEGFFPFPIFYEPGTEPTDSGKVFPVNQGAHSFMSKGM